MRRLYLLIGLTAMLVMAPVVALAGGGGSLCSGFGSGDTVVMRDNCFSATALFATPGQELTIVNEGEMEHSYTAVDGSFDTEVMKPGRTSTITAPDTGLVRVYCTVHSSRDGEGMAGVLFLDGDGTAGSQTSDAELASATTTAAPDSSTTDAVWPMAGAVVLAAAALAIALHANRRVATVLRD